MSWLFTILMFILSVFFPPATDDVGCERFERTFDWYGLPTDPGMRICFRESRGQVDAINSDDPNGGSFGLMQINAIHLRDIEVRPHLWRGVEVCSVTTTDDLLVGWKNICVAAHLYRAEGWDPWGG